MRAILATGLVLVLTGVVGAQDKKKADPTGTWKWESGMGDRKRTNTLKLKMDGDKLTGAMVGMNDMETKIEDATMKDGEITFSVTRERMGNKMTTKYKLKLDGDSLKGTAKTEGGQGGGREMEIDAKREKAEAKKDK